MEKLGHILLLMLNILINLFLIGAALVLILWFVFDLSPEKSVQGVMRFVEEKWASLTGKTLPKEIDQLSQKQKDRAFHELYVPERQNKERVTQPYKYK